MMLVLCITKDVALENLGKYGEAIEWYDKALEINPNHINSLSNKGLALTIWVNIKKP